MQTIHLTAKADADGVLRLNVPVGIEGEYEVTVSQKPHPVELDERGWPIGYFEATCGVIDDPAFMRYPQGELPPTVAFDE